MKAPSKPRRGAPGAAGPGWTRPEPARTGPQRGFGGFYRSADHELKGSLLRGVPLNTAQDAAVAAVKMAYRVADEQIDRGLRVARHLRGAAERAGHSPQDALDGSEQLLRKGLQAALLWVEDAAGNQQHPLRRLAAAEYRMLGNLLGLGPQGGGASLGERPAPARAASTAAATEALVPRPAAPPAHQVVVVNTAAKAQRKPVRDLALSWRAGPPTPQDFELALCHAGQPDLPPLEPCTLRMLANGVCELHLPATRLHASGCWVAGLYDAADRQVGLVEVTL